jgi:rhodanese-related sulfurtransferase
MLDQILAPVDYEMACILHRHIESKGVRLMLRNGVASISEDEKGLELTLRDGKLRADMLVIAAGVRPDTALAKAAGLDTNERGAIRVNNRMRTSDPNIYAVGDATETADFVTGRGAIIPLAGPANKQGRVASDCVSGLDSVYDGTQGSSIVRVFDIAAASTGVNEKTAREMGLDYDKSFTFSPSHANYYPGAAEIAMKTIFERETGRILGAQVIGRDGVDKRCDVMASAIRFRATAGDLAKLELCYAPPYSSAKDPVNMAGFVVSNIVGGLVRTYHWHDVDALPRDGSVTLLDTRPRAMYENGRIEGFRNIPLSELRGRLNELDKEKRIYVTCQIGQSAYAACRILSQNGFDCLNLSGGYRLYSSIREWENNHAA